MYHNSVCCRSVHPLMTRSQGNRSRCATQRNKFDDRHGGLHGLSFDPTNTHALLCAMNALQSMREARQENCRDSSPAQPSPCSSSSKSSASSDSCAAPSTPAPVPCPCTTGPAQSSTASEAVQTGASSDSTGDSTTTSSEENSSRDFSKGSVQAQAGVRTALRTGSEKNGLTWIDWGWPGTHTPCPFNQRHTVDDVLIRPQRIYCERSNGILCTFCPFIGKLVRCCKLRIRQLRAACLQEEIITAVDVKELVASYNFVADTPGMKHTDVEVQVENDHVLKISGERKREDAVQDGEVKYLRVERKVGKFMREFNLPASANPAKTVFSQSLCPRPHRPTSTNPGRLNVASANLLPGALIVT